MTPPDTITPSTRPDASAAARATYAAFIGCGFAFASWASRIPQVRDGLHLTPAALGLVLLTLAAGAVGPRPLAPRRRFDPRPGPGGGHRQPVPVPPHRGRHGRAHGGRPDG